MKRDLERRLEAVSDFSDPSAALEQYRTPAGLAAHVLHLASLHDDLQGRTVVDLGTGTGMLAIGAALAGASRAVGLEVDDGPLEQAAENESRVDPPLSIDWLNADATHPPLCVTDATVVMNPPFGAQRGQRHADREFLETTADLASVSYSIHNAGSQDFVEAFADDHGARVTHAFQAAFDLPHQFSFHESATQTLDAEVFRIVWDDVR